MTDSPFRLVSITVGICLLVNIVFVWTGAITAPPFVIEQAASVVGATLVPLLPGALGLLYRPNRGAGFMAAALGSLAIMSMGAFW